MSDNARLLAEAKALRKNYLHTADLLRLYDRLADALERAEREHAERLDALAAEITALRGEAERDENDLRAAAASEAAMREVAELAVANLNKLRAALSTPASALAQRYEAVVTAARNCAHAQQITEGMWSVHRSIEDLAKALGALDHLTPDKDDSNG